MFERNIVADVVIDVKKKDGLSNRWLFETLSPERKSHGSKKLSQLSWESFLEANWAMRMDGGSGCLH